MGKCTGCGGCCNPVTLPRHSVTKSRIKGEPEWQFSAPDGDDPERCKTWVRDDLRRISQGEALRRRPSLAIDPSWNRGVFFYECRHYDSALRQCRDYENRPSICRGFPWYGKEPIADTLEALPDCGYREDLA